MSSSPSNLKAISSREYGRILVIDRSILTLERVIREVGEKQYYYQWAGTAMEGLKKVVDFKPQLILLELDLPEMSGFGFLRAQKYNVDLKHIPVLVFTSIENEEVIQECINLGTADHLYKSSSALELKEKISKLLPVLNEQQGLLNSDLDNLLMDQLKKYISVN